MLTFHINYLEHFERPLNIKQKPILYVGARVHKKKERKKENNLRTYLSLQYTIIVPK